MLRRGTTALLLLTLACTDRDLYGKVGQEPAQADKIAFTGVLCTDNPATRKFPVKIMFIVESGDLLSEVAPQSEHVDAMEAVISQFLPIANVFVGVVRYDRDAVSLVTEMTGTVNSGFTRDPALLDGAIANLRNSGQGRDLAGALSLAGSLITGDAFQADRGPLSRTKYVVVHIVSGTPNPAILPIQCEGIFPVVPPICELAYLEKVVRDLRLQVLDLGAAELTFHTMFLDSGQVEGEPCDPRAGAGQCTSAPGLTCVQAGARPNAGRCVQLCDPAAPLCNANPARAACVSTRLPNGTTLDHCASGELACFDGMDNDRDGQTMDCADPNYPYACRGQMNCEEDCASACHVDRFGLAMALSTGGRYERFESYDQINLGRIDFRSTQRLFVLKEFLVFNKNAIPTLDGFVPDSDGDGLSDAEEAGLGLSPIEPDSDFDYYNDKLEHDLRTLGLDPQSPNTFPDCADPTIDTDGDGLYDCEEKLLGSDKTLFDTDADGFPDNIEFRTRTNILFNDNLDDLDLDGVNNGKEIRAHTDATTNDAKGRAELAYRYRSTDLGPTTDFRSCYDFRVSNVTLVNTLDRGFGPGINDIEIYFGQVPDGALEKFGLFHVSQQRIQYFPPDRRVPDTPAVDLDEDDFTFFEQ